jgi:hypothetical protein
MGSQERPLQHSAVELQPKPCGRQAQMLPEQKPLQHGPQEPPFDRHAAQVPLSQILLQHSLSASQEPPFGRHIGVVVEVVLVDVEVVLVEVAGVSVVEGVGVGVVVCVWQVPLRQTRLPQHCVSLVQCFPARLQPGGSAEASPPMPSDASVPPRRAAPINLRALPRVMVPSASPLARSSKKPSSLAIGCLLPE